MQPNSDSNSSNAAAPARKADGTIDSTIDRMTSAAHEAVDKVSNKSSDIAENLHQKGEKVNEVQERWLAPVRLYVKEHPMTSLGIAVVGGYLINRLLSSR